MYLLGGFLYVSVLLINAIAILSEDRFLARIGLSPATYDPAFGQPGGGGVGGGDASIKAKIINLIASVRTLMRIPLIVINTLLIVYELVLG
ncbi:protein transport protein YOS1 [Sporothrix schenckii 1099-18]|uniref:Protein transport protein YOS1 n=3 Tax=Sporothrix TaxID=29907 RepID=U7PVZ0_SPOS1|nr:protein transport protein YOS1 [Sporothrix schenckii 1099-18]XP_040619785.1 protein transport protein YOS1 [Sporothrix brasiliensis 5110]ERS99828.1 hypothetical protein HMPREF1624_03193 [Sporothrix schenckii ATCC 58251]KIH91775.1 protein transport protein YOS1 [Sporothrix brasiliensis 5110]KJR85787.1 protein transport protein YOS1 [Sporothrix schenckii 1099-18]